MKKFNFSLQKILEIKQQVLENLKIELSNLNQEYKTIEENIAHLKVTYNSVNVEFVEKSALSISVVEMSYYKMHMNSILKQIENNEEEKAAVQKRIESKRHEIINMNKEISSLEKLRENELEKYKKQIMKSEEIFIEEFVSNTSLAKKYAI